MGPWSEVERCRAVKLHPGSRRGVGVRRFPLAAAGKKSSAASFSAPGRTRAIARLGRCPRVFVDPFAFFC